jgi:ComF family protein
MALLVHASGRLLRRGFSIATDLLLPPTCTFCGNDLPSPAERPLLCGECRRAFQTARGPVCPRCAAPVSDVHRGEDCPRCERRRYHFTAARALGIYRDRLRDAVIRMKQARHEPLMLSVGLLLAERLRDWLAESPPDLLVPLPAHWFKRLWRGVNGPDLLVEAMGQALRIPTATDALVSCRRTRKQGTLLPAERFINVRDAFRVSADYDLTGAHVLLVDDIMTTGASASEAAKTLRRAGATSVRVAIVARGVGLDQRSWDDSRNDPFLGGTAASAVPCTPNASEHG